MYFIFPKKLNVDSDSAPVIAEEASIAGATNAAYGTSRPSGSGRSPTSRPTPTPIENRYSTGSMNPEMTTIQYAERRAATLRRVTDPERRIEASNRPSAPGPYDVASTIHPLDHEPAPVCPQGQPEPDARPQEQVGQVPGDHQRGQVRARQRRRPGQVDGVP